MIGGVRVLCLLALVQFAAFGASQKAASADVARLVFNSLYSDRDDVRLAGALDKVRMTEQLDPHLVLYFQQAGIGPRALAALQALQDKSRSLQPPRERALTVQPLPSQTDQKQMIERVVDYARAYVYRLPDFLCDEVTERSTNLKRTRWDKSPEYGSRLRRSDSFTKVLRFAGGSEQSQITRVNNKAARDLLTPYGESLSSGEFGGDMVIIFGPGVNADLGWDHWEMFQGKRTAVFSYFVRPGKSEFSLYYCCFEEPSLGAQQQSYKPPIRGLIYVDPRTGLISRLMIRAVDLPEAFRVKASNTIIDYGPVKIAGKTYTLPVSALMFMHSERQRNLNTIRFTKYRKFETESVFTYTESKVSYGSRSKK